MEDKLFLQAKSLIDAAQFHSIQWQLQQGSDVLSEGALAVPNASVPGPQSIYRIYSMTKPLVSFVTMQLIEQGKLSLNDKLSKFIPAMENLKVLESNGEFANLQTPNTVEHLLTHTAGFSYDFLPDCKVAEQYREVQLSGDATRTLAEVIGMLTTFPLASQPGETWRYSVATDVLAHVVENVSGMDLPQLLQQYLLEPSGMTDTAFNVPAEKLDRLMPMFGSRELGQVMTDTDEPNSLESLDAEMMHSYPTDATVGFYRGGHGLFSTLADYRCVMHVLRSGVTVDGRRLLSENNLASLWSNRLAPSLMPPTLGFNVMHGYGWNLMGRVLVDQSQAVIASATGEGGWAGAASTYFFIDRANDLQLVVMAQYIGSTPHLGSLMHHAAYSLLNNE